MEVVDGVTIVSPSDLVGYLACSHLTWLDMLAASSQLKRPERDDPMLELLRARGLDHERQYLQLLAAGGAEVVDIAAGGGGAQQRDDRRDELRAAETRTLEAITTGKPVIYQATFYDEPGAVVWRGHADFLCRVQSGSGQWSYEPEDTKLASYASAGAVLQLCAYAEQVARLQGVEPHEVHVVTGDGGRTSIRLAEVGAYYRRAKLRFLEVLSSPQETYPIPVRHCVVCRWITRCDARWDADDHLNRVAFLTSEQARHLQSIGVGTMAALAASDDDLVVPGISAAPLQRLRTQARLQHARIPGQPPPVELVQPVEAGMGLASLPEPDVGDLFYAMRR